MLCGRDERPELLGSVLERLLQVWLSSQESLDGLEVQLAGGVV